jgi:hypothetical protein
MIPLLGTMNPELESEDITMLAWLQSTVYVSLFQNIDISCV